METPTPISKVSTQSIEKSVKALLKWNSSKSETKKLKLLPSDEFIYLVLTLKKIPSKNRTNAHKISLPNPLYTPESSEFCLFVHDSVSKTAKQKVEEQGIPVSKAIKLSKLKKDYKAFEQKRKLCDSFDVFFADKRIIPQLPNAIGKQFYGKKKIPVPIELGRGNWKEQIDRVCSSALLYLSTGTCSVVKVAKASMEKDEILENVVAAIQGVAEVVPKKWGNIRAFHLKFSESLALPVYQKVSELGLKISGIAAGGVGNEEEKAVVAAKKEKKVMEKVGRKKEKGRIHEVRYMDNVEDRSMVGADEPGSDEDNNNDHDDVDEEMEGEKSEFGSAEIVGKKRKKGMKEVTKVKKGLKAKKSKSLIEKKSKKSKKLDSSEKRVPMVSKVQQGTLLQRKGQVAQDDPICVAARRDRKVLVTSLWVDHSFDSGGPVDPNYTMAGLMGAHFSKAMVAHKVTHLICYTFEAKLWKSSCSGNGPS